MDSNNFRYNPEIRLYAIKLNLQTTLNNAEGDIKTNFYMKGNEGATTIVLYQLVSIKQLSKWVLSQLEITIQPVRVRSNHGLR